MEADRHQLNNQQSNKTTVPSSSSRSGFQNDSKMTPDAAVIHIYDEIAKAKKKL